MMKEKTAMIFKPDFSKAYSKANDILVFSKIISKFPYSTKKLIGEQPNITCKSYNQAHLYNVDIEAFGSESAVAIQNEDGKTIIFYNQDETRERIRFSTLHEDGHIVLDHNLENKDKDVYDIYEIEANYFAAQLLMPEQILREFQRRGKRITKQFLIENFDVSESAAQKRLDTLVKTTWERNELETRFDDIILKKYLTWIDSVVPRRIEDFYLDEEEQQAERERWWNGRYLRGGD